MPVLLQTLLVQVVDDVRLVLASAVDHILRFYCFVALVVNVERWTIRLIEHLVQPLPLFEAGKIVVIEHAGPSEILVNWCREEGSLVQKLVVVVRTLKRARGVAFLWFNARVSQKKTFQVDLTIQNLVRIFIVLYDPFCQIAVEDCSVPMPSQVKISPSIVGESCVKLS